MLYFKKARISLFLGVVTLLLLSTISYFTIIHDHNQTTITENIEMNEAIASVLYSTNVTSEYKNEGKTFLAFFDAKGDVITYETSGLESNSIVTAQEHIILHEKDHVTTIDSQYHIEQYGLDDCSVKSGYGQSAGYFTAQNMSYGLFNQRFANDSSYYISTIRWSVEDSFYCKDIHEYILTDGQADDKLYLLSTDIVRQRDLFLVEIMLQSGSLVTKKFQISDQMTADTLVFSKLLAYEKHLYLLYSETIADEVELRLLVIDRNGKRMIDSYLLREYSIADDPLYFMHNKEAVQLIDDQIFYADGFGDVYSFHLLTKNVEKRFSFQDYERKEYLTDEMVYFSEDTIYFFRYDEQKKLHVLEQYDLRGKRIKVIEVPQLNELVRKSKVHIYDFKVLR